MTRTLLTIQRMGSSLWLSAIALPVFFATLFPPTSTAQNRWQPIDLGFESGFGTELLWPRPGAEMFWRDSSIGYYYTFDELNVEGGLIYYMTEDAGSTWQVLSNPIPIPHRIIDNSFGLNPGGFMTEDGGDSWAKIILPYTDTNYFPDQELRYTVTRSIAWDNGSIVVLFQLHDLDESVGDSIPYGPFRLGYTRDGGESWTFVDSIIVFGDVLQELAPVTRFGRFPAPANMTDTITNGWWKVLAMPTDTTALVVSKAYGMVTGGRTNVFYLGRLNLSSNTATWRLLPFSEPNFPPPASELRIEALSEQVLWGLQGRFADLVNNPDSLVWTIWRSENAGNSWDSIGVPSDVDFRSLRFVTPNVGVTSNAITSDGGRTWTYWTHPYERDGLFYAVDSANYRHVSRFSLYAHSADAGHTWSRNEAGGIPLDVNAIEGNVLVGRTYASLLLGSNQGSEWRDPGLTGAFPSRVHRVWTAAYPDFEYDSNRVVAIATIREYDRSERMVVMESTDGGVVWSVGQELDEFGYPSTNLALQFAVDPDAEVRDPVGFLSGPDGLYVTENDGVTWEFRNGDIRFEDLTMVNTQYGTAIAPDGIYQTTDGGLTFTLSEARSANQTLALGSDFVQPGTVGVMFSSRTDGKTNWSVEASEDLGASFVETSGGPAPRDMNIGAFWGDTSNIHTVSRFGIIQHSGDAGATFALEQDSTENFRAFIGYVEAGSDTGSIYIVGPGNSAAKFWMYWQRPSSVRETGDRSRSDVPLSLFGNPVYNGVVRFSLDPAVRPFGVTLYDAIGRVVFTGVPEATRDGIVEFDVAQLPAGRYNLEVQTRQGVGIVPVIIVR